jgi:hypothetical protein
MFDSIETSHAGSQNKEETSHHRQEVAVVQEETLMQRKTFQSHGL